jgi:hypothetical protein
MPISKWLLVTIGGKIAALHNNHGPIRIYHQRSTQRFETGLAPARE